MLKTASPGGKKKKRNVKGNKLRALPRDSHRKKKVKKKCRFRGNANVPWKKLKDGGSVLGTRCRFLEKGNVMLIGRGNKKSARET